MGVFRFKKFEIKNDASAMKVNTDGVLLGATAPISATCKNVLDIGTGTGLIALMLAQRLADGNGQHITDIDITGIDIEPKAAAEAAENFQASPWAESITAMHCSLKEFEAQLNGVRLFDLIVSNPPYYDSSLVNPDGRKAMARHTDTLSYREILDFAKERLSSEGILSLILPADQEMPLLRYARMCGLFPARILRIKTVERKKPARIIVNFSKERTAPANGQGQGCEHEDELILMEKGKYTLKYISLVKDFYLNV